ncbi:MAG TPA: NepR family anti-sigma factor [Phenylobacterium sp.]|nr:NepR family anti-sigma factor [Phenylobacterium sp.]
MTDQKRQARLQALNGALRRMFSGLSGRPVPDRLRSLVEQLDEEDAPEAPARRNRAR